MSAFENCTEVSPDCPVVATTYGYYPSLPANALFLAVSALCGFLQLYFGIRYKTWAFMTGLILCCTTQSIGCVMAILFSCLSSLLISLYSYIGRIMMESNPWNDAAFIMQMTCLIIGPAFVSASIYLTLKHFASTFGSEHSVVRPKWYTWMFIAADVLSILIQAVGGGLAASGDTQEDTDMGAQIMLGGIVWQVVSLAAFGILALLYLYRVHRSRNTLDQPKMDIARTRSFKLFLCAVAVAYIAIMVRCIYRIPELAGGWRNELMRKEIEFIILDSLMVTIALVALTVAHPGYCFPQMSGKVSWKDADTGIVEKANCGSDEETKDSH